MKVRLVNAAEDLRGLGAARRCEARTRAGACSSDARWRFTLDDGREVYVCRLHANAGERRGELEVMP